MYDQYLGKGPGHIFKLHGEAEFYFSMNYWGNRLNFKNIE